jgi:transposase
VLCDSEGNPLHIHLTPGQAHEASSFEEILRGVDEQLVDAAGRPIDWPDKLAGDKAYRAQRIDDELLQFGIQPVIPSKSNQDPSARPIDFDPADYRRRNIVERLIGWLKESRRVFARFEKTASNYAGMVTVACIRQYLRRSLGGL